MPTSIAKEFFERLATLEAQVANLMVYQKWQMGILAAILIAVVIRKI